MIDAKTAADIALKYVEDFYPNYVDFEVEEIDMTDDGNYWLITIGMQDPHNDSNKMIPIISLQRRKFKVVQINKVTKEVRKMYIRNL